MTVTATFYRCPICEATSSKMETHVHYYARRDRFGKEYQIAYAVKFEVTVKV